MTIRVFFILIILPLTALCQNQDANWYFGFYGGIQFSNGEPQDIGPGPFDVDEASACISDEDGNLLFSTSGEVVFDSNNNPMPNGSGLAGNFSSTQNAVIVPFPGDDENRFYYIFTVAAQVNQGQDENNGLEYVVVDMAENEGLGDVIQGSTELLPNTSEKIHATYHANQRDVWVVVHQIGSDAYYAYLITCQGIQDPVISNSGSVHEWDQYALGAIGAMKISPDGSRIASTFNVVSDIGVVVEAHLEVGTFDNSTGIVSITESVVKDDEENVQGYGLAFSPDNNKLYWSLFGSIDLFQYTPDVSPITDSEFLVSSTFINAYCGMQLGPDGRIYIARSNGAAYLSRIENPNAEGANVILTDEAVILSNLSKLGLPNNWMYPYPDPVVIPEEINDSAFFCEGESTLLMPSLNDVSSYLWSNGETTSSIEVSEPGFYSVEMEVACETVVQNFMVESVSPPAFQISPERSFCAGDSLLISIETSASVTWNDGNTSPSISVSEPGSYGFTVSNDLCLVDESVDVFQMQLPEIGAPDQIVKCDSRDAWYAPLLSHTDSLFVNGFYSEIPLTINSEGTFSVVAQNSCGTAQKYVHVESVDCTCHFFVPNAFTPNGDGVNDIFKPSLDCDPVHYQLRIFNRWGEPVFEGVDPSHGWNGELKESGYFAPDGIYAYQVEYKALVNGVLSEENQTGHVSLIR